MNHHHHHLDNPRAIPNLDGVDEPECSYCSRLLSELDTLAHVVTPKPGLTFCSHDCYSEWVIDGERPLHDERPIYETCRYDTPQPAHRPLQAPQRHAHTSPSSPRPSNRPTAHKSVARQTGEAAANVVGFLIWLVVISTIATLLFAVWH